MTPTDLKIELTAIQLMLNQNNIDVLNNENINSPETQRIQAHNDFIIDEIEKIKAKA